MKKFECVIKDVDGIHARPAGLLLREVRQCSSEVMLSKGSKSANALKLMAVMNLGVVCGDTVTVTVSGPDEEAVCEKLQEFFAQNL